MVGILVLGRTSAFLGVSSIGHIYSNGWIPLLSRRLKTVAENKKNDKIRD